LSIENGYSAPCLKTSSQSIRRAVNQNKNREVIMNLFNLEAEQAVLGIVLYENEAYHHIGGIINYTHFYEPFHQRLYKVISEAIDSGSRIDPILAAGKFNSDQAFNDLGGIKYIVDIIDKSPPAQNVADYSKSILNNWQLRCLSTFISLKDGDGEAKDVIESARSAIDEIDAHTPFEDGMETADTLISKTIDRMSDMVSTGKSLGLKTGIDSFDDVTGGLCGGDLLIIAGVASMGKSQMGRGLATKASKINQSHVFIYYSLEMTKFQVMARTLSEIAYHQGTKIPYRNYRNPTEGMVRDLAQYKNLVPKNFMVSDSVNRTWADIERSIRKISKQHKIGGVFVDHLHKVVLDTKAFDPYGQITGAAKNLAMDLDIPIALLSQMSRGVMSRENKRPLISDLRGSGSIEQDADIIIFPWREYQILKDEKPKKPSELLDWEENLESLKNKLTMIYAKVRNGEACDKTMWTNPAFDTFSDLKINLE
jgi:replicative DNA helicase